MKNKCRFIIWFFFCSTYAVISIAQTPSPTDGCAAAPLINTMGTYTGNTTSFTANDALWFKNSGAFCGASGNTVENNGFYKFVASATSISYTVCALNGCTNKNSGFGVSGIQFLIFEMPSGACGTGAITKKYCINQLAGTDCSACGNPKGCQAITTAGFTIGNTYYIMFDGYEGDDCPFSITFGPGIVLPIELLSFDGTAHDNGNDLHWVTASEKNSNYFELESSADGVNFRKITTLKAAGNSERILNYNFLDENPLAITTYYRLKTVDFDGSFGYYPIISVTSQGLNQLMIAPNPVVDVLSVNLNIKSTDTYIFSFVSMLGTIVEKEFYLEKGTNHQKIDLSQSLIPGFYILRVLDVNSEVIGTRKLIKN